MPHVLRRHPFLTVAFALAAALTLWLLVEVISHAVGWSGCRDEPLAPWMTMGYVGPVHGVPPREIDALAGFPTPQEAGHPLTIQEIAARQGKSVEEIIAEVEAALADLRNEHGRDDGPVTHGDAPPSPNAGGPSR
jgi:hypothetical protein